VTSRLTHSLLATLLLLGLTIRVAWALVQSAEVDARLPDQYEYLKLAENFLAGNGMRFYDARFYQDVVAFRTPGYPFFIALCNAKPRTVRLVQAVLDTSTAFAVYLIARQWLATGPSLLVVAAVAFNPFLVYFCGWLLTETLFTAMLVWGVALLMLRPNYLWGGIVLALSVLVRPSAAPLPVILGILAAFLHHVPGDVTPRRHRWLHLPVGTTMLLLVMLTLLPWALRNRGALGQWVWLTTNGGVTRYDGFNPDATGASDQSFLQSHEMRHLQKMSEVERDAYLSDLAGQWVSRTWQDDPAHLFRLTLAKLARTWSPIPLSEEFGGRRFYRMIAWLYSIPFYALVVLGLWGTAVPRVGKLLLLAPAAYFTVVHAMSVGSLRYRIPTEPLMAVLAAAGLAVFWARVRAGPSWRSSANDRAVGIVRDSAA
jgi:hypothetical protein